MSMEVLRRPVWVRYGEAIFVFVNRLRRRVVGILKSDRLEGLLLITAIMLSIFDACLLVAIVIGQLDQWALSKLAGRLMIFFLIWLMVFVCVSGLIDSRVHPRCRRIAQWASAVLFVIPFVALIYFKCY